MGSDLGQVLSVSHDVLWIGTGRSAETRERATAAGFVEAGTLPNLVTRSDVVISICPPHAAVEVAREVSVIRSAGFLYIDANSVAPGTVRGIAELFGPGVVVD